MQMSSDTCAEGKDDNDELTFYSNNVDVRARRDWRRADSQRVQLKKQTELLWRQLRASKPRQYRPRCRQQLDQQRKRQRGCHRDTKKRAANVGKHKNDEYDEYDRHDDNSWHVPSSSFPALDTGMLDCQKPALICRNVIRGNPKPNDRLQRLCNSLIATIFGFLGCYDHVALGVVSWHLRKISLMPHSWHLLCLPWRLQSNMGWHPRGYGVNDLDVEHFKSRFRKAAPVFLQWELCKASTFPATSRLKGLKLISHLQQPLLTLLKHRRFARLEYLELCEDELITLEPLSRLPALRTLKLQCMDPQIKSFSGCEKLALRSLTLVSKRWQKNALYYHSLALLSYLPLKELNLSLHFGFFGEDASCEPIFFAQLETLRLSLHRSRSNVLRVFRAPMLTTFEDVDATSYDSQGFEFAQFPLLQTLSVTAGSQIASSLVALPHLQNLAVKLHASDIVCLRELHRLKGLHITALGCHIGETLAHSLATLHKHRVRITGLTVIAIPPTQCHFAPIIDLNLPLRLLEICDCINSTADERWTRNLLADISLEQVCAFLPRECQVTTHRESSVFGCGHVRAYLENI